MSFLKNNFFWVVVVLLVLGIAIGYVFVARGMAKDNNELKQQSKKNEQLLDKWTGKKQIPNERMVQAAKKGEALWERHYGQLLMLFTSRSGLFDRDFDQFQVPFRREEKDVWEVEYERRKAYLISKTKRLLKTPDTPVLQFGDMGEFSDEEARRRRAQILQREYWLLKYAVEALAEAANAGSDEPALIASLSKLRFSPTAANLVSHKWVRAIGLEVGFTARSYPDLNKLLAAIHTGSKPMQVTSYAIKVESMAAAGGPEDVSAEAAARGALLRVAMTCDILEFMPAVHAVTFPTGLFEGPSAIGDWLTKQQVDLRAATQVLVRRVPRFRERLEAGLRWEMEDNLRKRLQAIERSAEEKREDLLEAAGASGPDAEAKVRDKVEQGQKIQRAQAHKDFQKELAEAIENSARFDLAHDFFVPAVPDEAYWIKDDTAPEESGRYPLIVVHWDGRWWVGDALKPGKPEVGGSVKRVSLGDNLKLIVNPVVGVVRQIRSRPPGGEWQSYDLAEHDARDASMSDAAFKFGYALIESQERLYSRRFREQTGTVIVTDQDKLVDEGEEIRVPIAPGIDRGDLVIKVRLRK